MRVALLACTLFALVLPAAAGPTEIADTAARAYLAAHQPKPSSRDKAMEEFRRGFFRGALNKDGGISGNPSPFIDGYREGQVFARTHPARFAELAAEFGYTPFDAFGTWASGFESSDFTSAQTPQGPWLTPLSPVEQAPCVRYRVQGFLSPEGQYGHLSIYTREVLATQVECVERPNAGG